MRTYLILILLIFLFISCTTKPSREVNLHSDLLSGTWKLVSSKVITGKDTLNTSPLNNQEMIKIFNGSHFAFFKHDLGKGKGNNATFDSGAGKYTLNGDNYQEHLEYCNYRDWENTSFKFKLAFKKDTLVQSGIEKIDSLNVDQQIVEIYVKVKK